MYPGRRAVKRAKRSGAASAAPAHAPRSEIHSASSARQTAARQRPLTSEGAALLALWISLRVRACEMIGREARVVQSEVRNR